MCLLLLFHWVVNFLGLFKIGPGEVLFFLIILDSLVNNQNFSERLGFMKFCWGGKVAQRPYECLIVKESASKSVKIF